MQIESNTLVELSKQLGVTAQELAPIYSEYMFISGVVDLGCLGIFCAILFLLSTFLYKKFTDESSDNGDKIAIFFISFFLSFGLSAFISVSVSNNVTKIVSPDGYALNEIVNKLGGSTAK